MKEYPIIFSGPMVRAILDGSKTQTRRIMKPQPYYGKTAHGERYWMWEDSKGSCIGQMHWAGKCPFGQPSDRLYVRETWAYIDNSEFDEPSYLEYRASTKNKYPGNWPKDVPVKWRPSIHMPRAASRITLEITGVRVERLNQISEQDAIAEGIEFQRQGITSAASGWKHYGSGRHNAKNPQHSFSTLWESIYGDGSFGDQYVWVVSFKRV